VTFDATVSSTGALFTNPECPETGDVEGVDEVSLDCCLCNMADPRSPRFIDCWSSYCIRLIKRLIVIESPSLEQYAVLSQVMYILQLWQLSTDNPY
jgi:hypothetical protein